MRRFFNRVRSVGLVLCLGLGLSGQAFANPVWTLCFEEANILPWRTANAQGLNFDLLRMTAQRVGVSLKFEALPWKRCLSELQANRVDGAFAASFHPDRRAIGVYPGGDVADDQKRMHVDRYVLIREKGGPVEWDGKTIKGLTGPVGAQLGYSVVGNLKALGIPVDDGSQTARELLFKLMQGRLAAAAVGGSDAMILMGLPEFATRLEVLPVPLVEKSYFLLLSHQLMREQGERGRQFWTVLEQVRNGDAYRKLERAAYEAALRP